MKQALREAGIPCARSAGASSAGEVRGFADQVGYPLIIKPRDGRIERYENLDETLAALSEWVIDHHFPPTGTPAQPVDAGYMANAWIRLRHPDFDELRRLLDRIGETVRIRVV